MAQMAADDYLGFSNQTQKSVEKKQTRFTKILHDHLRLCVTVLREVSSRKQWKSVYFKIILVSGR